MKTPNGSNAHFSVHDALDMNCNQLLPYVTAIPDTKLLDYLLAYVEWARDPEEISPLDRPR